jgi:hypothetical protein
MGVSKIVCGAPNFALLKKPREKVESEVKGKGDIVDVDASELR